MQLFQLYIFKAEMYDIQEIFSRLSLMIKSDSPHLYNEKINYMIQEMISDHGWYGDFQNYNKIMLRLSQAYPDLMFLLIVSDTENYYHKGEKI